jgi:hypothetical protein
MTKLVLAPPRTTNLSLTLLRTANKGLPPLVVCLAKNHYVFSIHSSCVFFCYSVSFFEYRIAVVFLDYDPPASYLLVLFVLPISS